MGDDDDEMVEVFDKDKIIGVVIVLCVLSVLIVAGWYVYTHYIITTPYLDICKNNPLERYAQSCTDKENCIYECARRLASNH